MPAHWLGLLFSLNPDSAIRILSAFSGPRASPCLQNGFLVFSSVCGFQFLQCCGPRIVFCWSVTLNKANTATSYQLRMETVFRFYFHQILANVKFFTKDSIVSWPVELVGSAWRYLYNLTYGNGIWNLKKFWAKGKERGVHCILALVSPRSKVHLWDEPAKVAGQPCGETGRLGG